MKPRKIHINTTNDASLKKGAEAVIDMFEDIGTYLSKRRERECTICHDIEWMNPGETVCWRCKRIKLGLTVSKPNGELGSFWWNYRLNAWIDMPPDSEQHLPEWGKLEEYS